MIGDQLLSRRDVIAGPLRRLTTAAAQAATASAGAAEAAPTVAVIQGRYCLAFRSLTCTTCYERCPEIDAITLERGVPRVTASRCTGCGVCRDVCPAPTKAVLMVTTAVRKRFPR